MRLLLERCAFGAYVPVDISGDFLQAQANDLRRDFPQLAVYPVAADFTAPFELPAEIAGMPKVGFFPGSTLGNFEPHEASAFLRTARDILGHGAQMIIGIDLEKDERTLYDAYNDAAGVTARFNLNVLERINRELGGNFDLSGFIHRSIYNRDRHRIEMHLISRKAQSVRLLGHNFSFRPGESIHTENSYKYSLARFTRARARRRLAGAGKLDRSGRDVLGSRADSRIDWQHLGGLASCAVEASPRASLPAWHGTGGTHERRHHLHRAARTFAVRAGLLRVAAASRESAQHWS